MAVLSTLRPSPVPSGEIVRDLVMGVLQDSSPDSTEPTEPIEPILFIILTPSRHIPRTTSYQTHFPDCKTVADPGFASNVLCWFTCTQDGDIAIRTPDDGQLCPSGWGYGKEVLKKYVSLGILALVAMKHIQDWCHDNTQALLCHIHGIFEQRTNTQITCIDEKPGCCATCSCPRYDVHNNFIAIPRHPMEPLNLSPTVSPLVYSLAPIIEFPTVVEQKWNHKTMLKLQKLYIRWQGRLWALRGLERAHAEVQGVLHMEGDLGPEMEGLGSVMLVDMEEVRNKVADLRTRISSTFEDAWRRGLTTGLFSSWKGVMGPHNHNIHIGKGNGYNFHIEEVHENLEVM